jgi:hypothetical protein
MSARPIRAFINSLAEALTDNAHPVRVPGGLAWLASDGREYHGLTVRRCGPGALVRIGANSVRIDPGRRWLRKHGRPRQATTRLEATATPAELLALVPWMAGWVRAVDAGDSAMIPESSVALEGWHSGDWPNGLWTAGAVQILCPERPSPAPDPCPAAVRSAAGKETGL